MKRNKKTDKKEPKRAAKKNHGPVKSVKAKSGNRLQGKTDTLHPVHTSAAEEPLYVPVPVSSTASLKKEERVHPEEQASPDVLRSADTFVKTLVDNNEIEGAGSETKPNPTHKIEVNEQGQQVVKRRGFRAF